jgi:hypothetical protein
VILSGLKASKFSIRTRIRPAWWQTRIFRIILYWKRTLDHLVLDNSEAPGKRSVGVYSLCHPELLLAGPAGPGATQIASALEDER